MPSLTRITCPFTQCARVTPESWSDVERLRRVEPSLAGRRGEFVAAVHSAPVAPLVLATLLQILALVARTEAWYVCVRASGGWVRRRLLFRAAGAGYLASQINGSVGMAARIASLRRIAGPAAPGVRTLLAAEVPIITVEVVLAAVFSFTLIAPLGVPWWVPTIAVLVMVGAVVGLRRISECRRTGVWASLAVVRETGRGHM
jgi:hypothetical protein